MEDCNNGFSSSHLTVSMPFDTNFAVIPPMWTQACDLLCPMGCGSRKLERKQNHKKHLCKWANTIAILTSY